MPERPVAAPPDARPDPTHGSDTVPRAALDEQRRRTLEAAEDARRAERALLETTRRLQAAEAELETLRARSQTLASRRAIRVADGVAERRKATVRAIRQLAGREPPAPAPAPVLRPRVVADGGDARTIPARYRTALLDALHGRSPDASLRVGVLDGEWSAPIARTLASAGHRVETGPTIPADVDVLVLSDAQAAPESWPPGPVRVRWRHAPATAAADAADRSEADLELLAGPDDGDAFTGALDAWLRALRVGIRIPARSVQDAEGWGDLYFARDLRTAFRAAGHPARIHVRKQWVHPAVARDDIVIDLVGLHLPAAPAGAARVLWQISHPELASDTFYTGYDRVFVASAPFAELMAAAVPGTTVEVLHQATDPARFRPDAAGARHEVLVVANWRPGRRIVQDLVPTAHDLAVHGRGWPAEELPAGVTVGAPIPNDELPAAYAGAAIVANDHAPGMRREGFPSNRLFDAAAAGALVISDRVAGIDETFDGGIPTYRDGAELRGLVDRYLADEPLRQATAARARAAVLAHHTFAHRAARILEAVAPILAAVSAGRT